MRSIKLDKILGTFVMAAALALLVTGPRSHAQAGPVVTPLDSYSDGAWRGRAQQHQSDLAALQSEISRQYNSSQLKFVTASESAGGVGLWANPAGSGSGRYLCVFAKVVVPPPSTGRPFGDDQTGRLLTIWDAYGKGIIGLMSKKLDKINEPAISGGGIILIYSKKPLSDPSFYQTAEAFALFMPQKSVSLYAQYRMTNQTLFSQSEMFGVLTGADQVQTLLAIIRP